MAATRKDHPLALLFWSQFFLVYALPAGLEIIYRLRGGNVAPGNILCAFVEIYPFLMIAAATMTVLADFGSLYAYVIRSARRLPGIAVGAIYALFAFVAVALIQSGTRNSGIAWADYVEQGSTTGIIILLLALVFEMFAGTFMVCQMIALARRWRRLARLASPAARLQN